ncbi:hypothetical protein ACFCWB_21735 [Streptomyces bacillaris]|uniref:hypothetical protein n=1 Tax=Streptomyces bacillaris TaxID=68179 RepID=UPI0035DBD7E1
METSAAVRWNTGEPRRCPSCATVAIGEGKPTSWRVYTCRACTTRFTRWPILAFALPHA